MEAVVPTLEVFAMDNEWGRLTLSIEYNSLQWKRRYFECGSFVMEVPSDIYTPDWAFIFCYDRPETGIVQKVEYNDTAQGEGAVDTVIVSGFFLEWLASNRVIKTARSYTGPVGIVCTMIAQEVMTNSYGFDVEYLQPDIETETQSISPEKQNLDTFLYDKLKAVGCSFRVVYDFETNKAVFQVWRGNNRTQEGNISGEPWAVFSDERGTMYDFKASDDVSNCKNTCYNFYSYDRPVGFDSRGRPAIAIHLISVPAIAVNPDTGESTGEAINLLRADGWYVPYQKLESYATATVDDGRPKNETFIDSTQKKPEGDSTWSREVYKTVDSPAMPFEWDVPKPKEWDDTQDQTNNKMIGLNQKYAAFEQSLTQDGIDKLKNDYGRITNLDTGTLDYEGYMKDWDLGDLVDASLSVIGWNDQTRIIGVDEVYEGDNFSINPILGDELMTLSKKANLI